MTFIPITDIDIEQDDETGEYVCGYIGFGSRRRELRTSEVRWLGFSYSATRGKGLLADIALGWLSGFPVSAIIWYVLTRSLPTDRMQRRIFAWEARTGRYDGTSYEVVHGEPVKLMDLLFPKPRTCADPSRSGRMSA